MADLNQLIVAHPWLIPLFAVCAWCVTCWLVAWMSGWRLLAARFTRHNEPYGETRTAGGIFTVVYLRAWCKYSGAVRLTAAADGLYLSVMLLLRPGHAPLRIPWEEITLNRTERWFLCLVEMRLGREEQVPMRITEATARRLGLLERFSR